MPPRTRPSARNRLQSLSSSRPSTRVEPTSDRGPADFSSQSDQRGGERQARDERPEAKLVGAYHQSTTWRRARRAQRARTQRPARVAQARHRPRPPPRETRIGEHDVPFGARFEPLLDVLGLSSVVSTGREVQARPNGAPSGTIRRWGRAAWPGARRRSRRRGPVRGSQPSRGVERQPKSRSTRRRGRVRVWGVSPAKGGGAVALRTKWLTRPVRRRWARPRTPATGATGRESHSPRSRAGPPR